MQILCVPAYVLKTVELLEVKRLILKAREVNCDWLQNPGHSFHVDRPGNFAQYSKLTVREYDLFDFTC